MLRFLKLTATRLATNVRTVLAQTRGYGAEGADDDAESQDDVEIVQPLGLMVRPVIAAGLELLAAEIGDATLGIALINKALSALDVEAGETRLYGALQPTARIRLRGDGSVDIEALSGEAIRITTAGGGDVVVNGGSLRVARVTDPTAGHAHGNGGLVVVVPPGGAGGTFPVTGAMDSATDTIAFGAGAADFKA